MPFRPRALIVLATALVVVGLVAVALPDRHDAKGSVGTEGAAARDDGAPDRTDGTAEDAAASPTEATEGADEDEDETIRTGTPRSTGTTAPGPIGGPSTAGAPGASTPTTTIPTPEPEDLGGSADLRGRVMFLQGSAERMRSMLPDGTDLRDEVRCPHDGVIAGGYDASPDGRWIVVVCSEYNPATGMGGAFGTFKLWQLRSDGSEVRELAADEWGVVTSSWSPDSATIAVRDRNGVTLYDAAGGPSRTIDTPIPNPADANSARGWSRVTWSPDGTRLLLDNLYVYDLETTAVTSLWPEDSAANDYSDATWSTDGTWIYVFTYLHSWYSDPRSKLQRINVTTLEVDVVLDDLQWGPNGMLSPLQSQSWISRPALLPGGDLVLVWGNQLWRMHADGSDLQVVADLQVGPVYTTLG